MEPALDWLLIDARKRSHLQVARAEAWELVLLVDALIFQLLLSLVAV